MAECSAQSSVFRQGPELLMSMGRAVLSLPEDSCGGQKICGASSQMDSSDAEQDRRGARYLLSLLAAAFAEREFGSGDVVIVRGTYWARIASYIYLSLLTLKSLLPNGSPCSSQSHIMPKEPKKPGEAGKLQTSRELVQKRMLISGFKFTRTREKNLRHQRIVAIMCEQLPSASRKAETKQHPTKPNTPASARKKQQRLSAEIQDEREGWRHRARR